jgi:hypothetical protein
MDIDSSEEEEVVKKPAPKPRGRPKGSKNKAPAKKTLARAAKNKAAVVDDESSRVKRKGNWIWKRLIHRLSWRMKKIKSISIPCPSLNVKLFLVNVSKS